MCWNAAVLSDLESQNDPGALNSSAKRTVLISLGGFWARCWIFLYFGATSVHFPSVKGTASLLWDGGADASEWTNHQQEASPWFFQMYVVTTCMMNQRMSGRGVGADVCGPRRWRVQSAPKWGAACCLGREQVCQGGACFISFGKKRKKQPDGCWDQWSRAAWRREAVGGRLLSEPWQMHVPFTFLLTSKWKWHVAHICTCAWEHEHTHRLLERAHVL